VNSHFSYINFSLLTALWPTDGLSILEGTFNFTLKNLLTSTIEGSKSKSAAQLKKSYGFSLQALRYHIRRMPLVSTMLSAVQGLHTFTLMRTTDGESICEFQGAYLLQNSPYYFQFQ